MEEKVLFAKYVFVKQRETNYNAFEEGEVITLVVDDDSDRPLFRSEERDLHQFTFMDEVKLLD